MLRVKSQCMNCGEVETYSKRELFFKTFFKMLTAFFVALGIVSLFLIIYFGPEQVVSNFGVSAYLTIGSRIDTVELRHIAINATEECRDYYATSSLCNSIELFEHLEDIKYVYASLYDPVLPLSDTYDVMAGDCKAVSMLFTGMMKSIGFKAQVQCKKDHCISIIPNQNDGEFYPGYIVADLTIPGLYEVKSFDKIWNYQDGVQLIPSK